ncbi:MAG: hypothetical protein M3Y59_20380 [Myxococcota bacterium]|nr:hypothetical protein [Myxococcota bacterium]
MSALAATLALLVATQTPPPEELSDSDVVEITPKAKEAESDLPWHLPPTPAPTQEQKAPDLFDTIATVQLRGYTGALTGGALMVQAEFSFGKLMTGLVGLAPLDELSGERPVAGLVLAAGLGGNLGLKVYQGNGTTVSILGPELEGGVVVKFDEEIVPWADVGLSGVRVVFCPFKIDLRPRINIAGSFGLSLDVGFL